MTKGQPIHSAAQSAAGYLYQARLALAECLRYVYIESDLDISIEKLDDVAFEQDGNPLELLQTKHHLKKSGDLTDGSVDLWKTLRIWAEETKRDPSLPGRTRLLLVTTAKAPDESAASHLRPESVVGLDVAKAEAKLIAAAAASRNEVLTKAVQAFNDLTPAMRTALISAIDVIDGAPLIADLGEVIENRLRMIAPRGKHVVAREYLEGWWWPRVCRSLQSETPGTISILDVEQKLDDIRDSLKRDALPFDMEAIDPPIEELSQLDEMRFVRQLHGIGVGQARLELAKRDFYKASAQRSRWIRHSLLYDGEVGKFERTLIEEWQPRYQQMCEDLAEDCPDSALKQAGKILYTWVENEARFPIRMAVSRFLNVGSYHILAETLRLGWHRDFKVLHGDSKPEGSNDS